MKAIEADFMGFLKTIELETESAILCGNNTPHASRQIGAPWGVTRFWGIVNAFREAS